MPQPVRFRQRSALTSIGGFTAIAAYLVGTVVSWTLYPGRFTPLRNWLSDLGNPVRNPKGAAWYNAGCLLTAAGLLLFMLGLGHWRSLAHRLQRTLISTAQVLGVVSVLFLAGIGLNPESHLRQHMAASNGFFASFPLFILFLSSGLIVPPCRNNATGLLGLGVVLLGVGFHLLLPGSRPLEWATELGFLMFVGCVAWNGR